MQLLYKNMQIKNVVKEHLTMSVFRHAKWPFYDILRWPFTSGIDCEKSPIAHL